MSAQSFADLRTHIGHKLACVSYGSEPGKPVNVAIECEDCSTVLLDFDKPTRKTKADKRRESIEERRGSWDFDDHNFPRCDWYAEVGSNDTQLGYIDWVIHKYDAAEESGLKL
jgi:hypothetical protein